MEKRGTIMPRQRQFLLQIRAAVGQLFYEIWKVQLDLWLCLVSNSSKALSTCCSCLIRLTCAKGEMMLEKQIAEAYTCGSYLTKLIWLSNSEESPRALDLAELGDI